MWTVKGISGTLPQEPPAQLWVPIPALLLAPRQPQCPCSTHTVGDTALRKCLYSPFAAGTGRVGPEEKRDLV